MDPFLRRPELASDPAKVEAFDRLFERVQSKPGGAWIDYDLPYPKWEFLCHLTDHKAVLAHGTGNGAIEVFEPRQSNDVFEFGDAKAVYAASDALWAMYFAIVDRDGPVRSLVNASFTVAGSDDRRPRYYFSINESAIPLEPWRSGVIYLLPRDDFEREANFKRRDGEFELAHWRSFETIRPIAKMAVKPEDFPFLRQIKGHNPAEVGARAEADPQGFPWE